jgi:hypothetical protein
VHPKPLEATPTNSPETKTRGRVVESGPPGQLFEAASSARLQGFISRVL